LGGASGSFREHGFSYRPTLCDRRIVGAGAGAELLKQRLFCLRRSVLPLLQIGEHVPSHLRISFLWCGGFEVPSSIAARSDRNFKSKTALES
jgi:hypothetical protein